jgi:hypothetical protein
MRPVAQPAFASTAGGRHVGNGSRQGRLVAAHGGVGETELLLISAMEKYLQKLEAWCWRYKENARNYPGLHFTARPSACDALTACVRQLRREGNGGRRTMPLRPLLPEDEAKVTGGQAFEYFSRLRISLHDETNRLRQMSFRVENGVVYLDFTERSMAEFEQGLRDVKAGQGDYSIEPQQRHGEGLWLGELDRVSECLWFWPCFGHSRVEN